MIKILCVMAGRIQIFIFVFCRLSMDYCGDDYDDHDIQEEMWDDGFSNDQDDIPDHPRPLQEPRQRFNTRWQVVLSLQVLPGGKVQASAKHWPKTLVDASRYDPNPYSPRTIPCPHCKFYCPTHADLAEEKLYHRRCFIEDNLKRAEEKAAAALQKTQQPRN